MDKTPTPSPTPRAAWSVFEFCERYSVSKGAVFALLRDGKLRRVKNGRRTLIPVESADEWWASLQKAS